MYANKHNICGYPKRLGVIFVQVPWLGMWGSCGVHVGWGNLKDGTISFLKKPIFPVLPFLLSFRNSALDSVREWRNVNPNPKLKA